VKIVQPKVILLAETKLVIGGLDEVAAEAGAPDWWSVDPRSDSEILIEASGRMCYRSWVPGLNPNVTKVREGNHGYIGNILKQQHGSVLEHASTTWAFLNVSRVFTHELVRHRAGTAISQESLRYVRLEDIPFAATSELPSHAISETVSSLEHVQIQLAEIFELDKAETGFAYKKRKTSAMRRLAPLGLATNMIWTCNMRELRHVITLRTDSGAEEEIRKVIGMLANIAIPRYPAIFQDFTKKEDGSWEPENWKI
jgi:thymidylate synthase (FAD)